MEHKYELAEDLYYPESNHIEIIGILTGIDPADIIKVAPDRGVWYTRDYIQVYNDLGFSTNPRFVAFDPDTAYPCMMRYYRNPKTDSYWHAIAYYDGWLYFGCSMKCEFDHWLEHYKGKVRVTSMLQVWI